MIHNHEQQPWKQSLPQYVEELHFKRFGKSQAAAFYSWGAVVSVKRLMSDEKRTHVRKYTLGEWIPCIWMTVEYVSNWKQNLVEAAGVEPERVLRTRTWLILPKG